MSKEQKKKLKESWTSPTFLHSKCKLDPSMFLPSNYAFTLKINIIIFPVLYKLHSVIGPLAGEIAKRTDTWKQYVRSSSLLL